ncbi:ATP-binding protein [Agarilytica rhodophyticola]|uniref:ATP-binding protein n=1 Tax=Agarilytica rhodophyticola TaxID=1737490 RepID=UPI000B344747|nr:ATP-binding protein [Agarilytica rhodophyticola]
MRKLIISLICAVVLTIVGLGWAIGHYYNYLLERETGHQSNELMIYESLGRSLAATLNRQQDVAMFARYWPLNSSVSLAILEREDMPLPSELIGSFLDGEPVMLETDNEVSLHFYLPAQNQVMAFILPLSEAEDVEISLSLTLTLLFYAGVIFVVLMWLYPLIRRLNVLQKTALSFGAGELQARVKRSPMSYISEIEIEFNRMADRIQTLLSDNKLLSRAVSHDLKTPLARLRFGIETLAESETNEQRERYHARLENDLTAMELLIDTLLQYARLDESNINFNMEKINFAELIQYSADQMCDVRSFVSFNIKGECVIDGDQKYLQMLVCNLVQNAINYADTKVHLSLNDMDDKLLFTVEDDGKGIDEDQRINVLKPFVRGSNSDQNKGHGMGLAIVSRIADWHNASVVIDDSPRYGGARISVCFSKKVS